MKKPKTDLELSQAIGCSVATARKLRKEDGLTRGSDGFDLSKAKNLLKERRNRKKGEGPTLDAESIKWRRLYEQYRARFKKLEFELMAQKAKFSDEAEQALKQHCRVFVWLIQVRLPMEIANALVEIADREKVLRIYDVAKNLCVEGLTKVGMGEVPESEICCTGGDHGKTNRKEKANTEEETHEPRRNS
jgi:hypothetical protein